VLAAGAFGWLGMAVFVEGDWVSGWIPALVGFMAVTVFLRPRTGVLLVIACVVLVAAYNSVFYSMLVTQQEQDGSLGGEFGRLQLWQRNLAVIEGRYYLGTGPAGYALYYVAFVPDQAMSTHSNYVDTLAQFGVPGVVGLLGLLGSLWVSGIRALRRLADERDRVACAVVLGGLPALGVAMWLGDWLIPFVYNQTIAGFDHSVYSWLMLAMLCGLIAQVHTQVVQEMARA
jgi:O-antigen ligase